jgi:hypothetical protein
MLEIHVRVTGELDEAATLQVVNEVRARTTPDTALVVVSLAEATEVHWDALCRLERATTLWRAACLTVVLEGARPSLRALLAAVDCLASVRLAPA